MWQKLPGSSLKSTQMGLKLFWSFQIFKSGLMIEGRNDLVCIENSTLDK